MFLLRGRVFVGKFLRVAQSSLLETAPKVCAVKLMHTIHFYNNGNFRLIILNVFHVNTYYLSRT